MSDMGQLPECAPPSKVIELCEQLHLELTQSSASVEREIAQLLKARTMDAAIAFRLRRYQRKIDVARRVMAAYDEQMVSATSQQVVSSEAYLALALVFTMAACNETGSPYPVRCHRARWMNSAFNCMAHVSDLGPVMNEQVDALSQELLSLLERMLPT